MSTIHYNYKSDFPLKIVLPTGQESEDFAMEFYTDDHARFRVSRIGDVYRHCAETDTKGTVMATFVNHGLGAGTLKHELLTWADNSYNADGDFRTNTPTVDDVELVTGAGDDQSEAEIQAAIDCIKAALEAQSAANEAMAAKVEADLATAKALTAASEITTPLENMEKAVDGNTVSVDSLKAVQSSEVSLIGEIKELLRLRQAVDIINGTDCNVKFQGSTFIKLPSINFSDKATILDFTSMFASCKKIASLNTDELVAMFPMFTSADANCSSMFLYCTGLTSVTISHDLSGILYGMFQSCTGLTSVTISHDLSGNLYGMFLYCTGLTSVTVTATMTQFPSLQWTTKLDKASVESIINHLADLTGKPMQTLILSKTAITTDYGSTTADEWTTLVASATAKNWTVSLI